MKKYELGESKEFNGRTLFRVVALVSFRSVSVGDIGGWIEKEANLSHYNDAWVSGNAQVWGNAQVSGNAQVLDDAWVSGDAQVLDDAQVSGDAWVWGDAQVWKLAQTIRTEKYHITISDSHIQIGCKNYTFEEWENFDDETISRMDTGALKWWKTYKPIIFSINKAEGK